MSASQRLAQALAHFEPVAGQDPIRFGLERMHVALERLGQPQTRMPPAIHICGTNGKGSTIAQCRAIAQRAGLRVHVYTSPHLLRVNERIRLAGCLVSDEALTEALIRAAATQVELSWFEALTIVAFCLFAEHEADLCLIETGAGGGLDASNALSQTAICIVTAIGRDHEALFGVSGLAEIARVKSGIFRPQVPVIMAEQDQAVRQVLLESAQDLAAPVWLERRDWTADLSPEFRFRMGDFAAGGNLLSLAGAYQASNAGLACAAFCVLNRSGILPSKVSGAHMAEGLTQSVWPGRLQSLSDGPLTRRVAMPVWLDGAHNPHAAQRLAAEVERHGGKSVLLLAIGAQKDVSGILEPLSRVSDRIIACRLPGGGGAEPQAIMAMAEGFGVDCDAADSLEMGLDRVKQWGADRLFITGSLYWVAEALRANDESIE